MKRNCDVEFLNVQLSYNNDHNNNNDNNPMGCKDKNRYSLLPESINHNIKVN